MRRLVVVGGGISGLAAAWSAHEVQAALDPERRFDVVLLERESQVGGKARSRRRDGWLIEEGPTGFLDNEPVLNELVARAQLEPLPADAAAKHRYLVRGGRLREVQMNPLRFATSGVLSPLGMLRMVREPWIAKRVPAGLADDESVWDFAQRRLGREAATQMIAPMVLGVFAGDARRLSLASAFPRMAELEGEYGSLFRALFALKRARNKTSGGPAGPAGTLTSFANGLESLPSELARRAPFEVRTGRAVRALVPTGGVRPWRIELDGGAEPLEADALVLAGDARSSAAMLRAAAPTLATAIDGIACPGVAVVGLGYGREALERAPLGFGALIPRGEGLRILGVLWDTHLFPGRSPEGRILMRAMIGGATDPEAAGLPEEELARIAAADVARLLRLDTPPEFRHVVRWPSAIPQYELGHAQRVQSIEAALAELCTRAPRLALAGNYLEGIAFGKAAKRGWETGAAAARELADTPA